MFQNCTNSSFQWCHKSKPSHKMSKSSSALAELSSHGRCGTVKKTFPKASSPNSPCSSPSTPYSQQRKICGPHTQKPFVSWIWELLKTNRLDDLHIASQITGQVRVTLHWDCAEEEGFQGQRTSVSTYLQEAYHNAILSSPITKTPV